ncbi:MAG TPA: heavy-metal-associated domain-containing protein [Micropepsaceae bacterium]|nr:heavy-metal-associated domain-containing protein [Micropepsaceae bacterium]
MNASALEPIYQATLIAFGSLSMKTAQLSVKGMDCGGCVKAVERAARGVTGVAAAKVDLAGASAVIEFDESQTSVDAVANAITRAGFKAEARV